jgi:hypothetical protein
MENPLEGLRDVVWEALHDAYGPASSVPASLEMLASPDPEDRDEGRFQLYMSVCHQSASVWEATAHVVPWLIRLLESPDVRDKGRICDLLGHVAQARGAWHAELRFMDEEVRRAPGTRERLAEESGWMSSSRTAVRGGVRAYARLLHAPDRPSQPRGEGGPVGEEGAAARCGAAFVLSRIDPVPDGLVELLRARLIKEQHPDVRAAYLLALGRLQAYEPVVGVADQRFASDRDRLAACLALVREPVHATAARIRRVGDALSAPEGAGWGEFDPDALGVPMAFADQGTLRATVRRILRLPLEQLRPAWPGLMKMIRQGDAYSTGFGARPILERIFYEPHPPLSPEQLEAITAVVETDAYWEGDTHPLDAVLSEQGLPVDRDALRAVLSRKPPPLPAEVFDDLAEMELDLDPENTGAQ